MINIISRLEGKVGQDKINGDDGRLCTFNSVLLCLLGGKIQGLLRVKTGCQHPLYLKLKTLPNIPSNLTYDIS